MSEWYDAQQKSNVDIQTWIQQRIEKTNPRRTLTSEEAKRLNKLEAIADRLRRGENVQNRQLQTWLSEEEYAQIEVLWTEQLELREELKDKPFELSRYEKKLRHATFNYNRAEGYSRKGKHSTAKKFYNKSENLCEDALEILHEILQSNLYLQTWFDRDICFDAEHGITADIASMPRLITSRSHERLRQDSRIRSKLDVKLDVVEQAMFSIGR